MKEFKQEFQTYDKRKLNNAFINSCKNGHLTLIKYLLTSPDLKEHADLHTDGDYGFQLACLNNEFELVRYLLTSPDLKTHADIHSEDDLGFRWACKHGHYDIVEYLSNSKELKDHADIHACYDNGFRSACQYGHLKIVEYLVTSSNLESRINLGCSGLLGFVDAGEEGHITVMTYLLSVSKEYFINFQDTPYNLSWAIHHQHHDLIFSMMLHLQKHNPIQYIEHVSTIRMYCEDLYLQLQKNITSDTCDTPETILFV